MNLNAQHQAFQDPSFIMSVGNDNYPPYNSWIEENGDIILEMAVARFSKEEISIEYDTYNLVVKGIKSDENVDIIENRKYINRNLAKRNFVRTWKIAGNFLLESAKLTDGILTIYFRNDIKKVTIEIT